MFLPDSLLKGIEELLENEPLGTLQAASQSLSSLYKEGHPEVKEKEHLAYLAARLPATYAAACFVFEKAPLVPASCLDIGSGPGGCAWAACAAYPSISRCTMVEKDPTFIAYAKHLAKGHPVLSSASFAHTFSPHDLVLFSYSFGEIAEESVLKRAWEAAVQALILIEPGTPRGYATILEARQKLISWGASILAPCPHKAACPLQNTPDWCHFAARLPRTSLHRKVKGASLSYEDEKLSYLVVTKQPHNTAKARILKTPQKRTGHLILTLCTAEGLVHETVSRRQGPLYKQAQKKAWGDEWDV